MIKKLLFILVVYVMFSITFLSPTSKVYANSEVFATHSSLYAKKGDKIEIIVSISNCPLINSMGISPVYDKEKVKLIKGEFLLNDALICDWSDIEENGVILFSSLTDINGEVVKFSFQIFDDVSLEDIIITSKIVIKSSSNTIPITIEPSIITLCSHNWSEWIITKEETCEEFGEKTSICNICGKEKTEIIPEKGHNFGDELILESTCLNEGYKYKICSECGKKIETEIVGKKDHIASGWIIDFEATYNSEGFKHKECITCGEIVDTEVIQYQGKSLFKLPSYAIALISIGSVLIIEFCIFIVFVFIRKKVSK